METTQAKPIREKYVQEMRALILGTAQKIYKEEGAQALTIRKIAKQMEYSPGIIYHYFKNKEEILAILREEGFHKILHSTEPPSSLPPDRAMESFLLKFCDNALKNPDAFREVMFDNAPSVLEYTSFLGEPTKYRAVNRIANLLNAGVEQGQFAPCDPALTARALMCSLFGLVSRLVTEKGVAADRRFNLLVTQVKLLMRGLRA
ncbi:TetR/AcrR family transcriptional regulator [Christensenellaceae bacterium OttesenSCG-928-K19]|nr:TetR/AcrR family transcriptional regulator [Christensenellaceae bacterium OttesenSCG-928-K19]